MLCYLLHRETISNSFCFFYTEEGRRGASGVQHLQWLIQTTAGFFTVHNRVNRFKELEIEIEIVLELGPCLVASKYILIFWNILNNAW